MRWLVANLRRDERGISLLFVAILLIVLFGFTAFAVDAAALYEEKRELQNGADAAVLAIAEDCALGATACDAATAYATAEIYADANALDSAASVESIDVDVAAGTVEVTTATEDTAGSSIFAPWFAQVLGYGGTTVRATARAAWGHPKGLTTLPLIISECEWGKPEVIPEEGPPFTGDPVVFTFHDGNTTEDCNSVAGHDWDGDNRLPGGFGWLETIVDCSVDLDIGDWAPEDPGASPSTGCSAKELEDLILNKVVMIPYFSDVRGLGASGEYLVSGFGAFYVTGYNFGGKYKEPSSKDAPCSGDVRCIAGYPTFATYSDGELGGPDRGVIIIKLSG